MAGGADSAALARRVAEVKDRIMLSDIIGRDIALTKAGSEYRALCPFHVENTPSFTINDDKQFYKCFGCGASGDLIKYIMERRGEPFMKVLRDLEGDAGIAFDTPENRAEIERKREERRKSNAAASKAKRERARGLWFHAAPIKGTPAESYLAETRGIDFALLGKYPGALRYRHDCWHPYLKEKMPAMVAAIYDLLNQHRATHQTYLEYRPGPDGRLRWDKLKRLDEVESRKRGREVFHAAKTILGTFKGCSIPIRKGACNVTLPKIPPGTPVAVSEGIEDALSFAMLQPDLHIRAAGTLDKIGSLILPPQTGDLTIIGQWDRVAEEEGQRSAVDQLEDAIALQQEQADLQATADGVVRRVLIAWPPQGVKDWNDVVRGVKA